MPALRLFLLGPLDIRCDGQQMPKSPTLKSQSLFAYLALHRQRPQSREHLANLFWGDRPERKARRSLTTALWHIRRALPDDAILLAGPRTVQLDPQADLWLDVDEFEVLASRQDLASLQSAAALYRGALLENFYNDWILTIRYRLETLFDDVLTRLMTGQEAAGEHQAALTTARRLLEHDPPREDAHRLAMRAFCHLGQRGAALEQYRRCRETVQQELNTEPMVETNDLYRAILEGQYEIGSQEETIPAPVAEELPPTHGYHPLEATALPPLVGREQEMAILQDCYLEAGQDQEVMILVSGEAGVGKTRLVSELAQQLRWQGTSVLSGRCYEFERFLPYQPIAEALGNVVPTMTRSELESHPAWVLVEVARLVPELLGKIPELNATPALRSEEERLRFFEGLVRFLSYLSTQGRLLLVLEDLHWATESTLQLIHYLVRHLVTHPILLLATFRPEAVGRRHPLQALRQELARGRLLASLHLDPLSMMAVEDLVAEMSGANVATLPLARRLYAETEGNPFFLMEVVRALFEQQRLALEEGQWQGDFSRISKADLPLPTGVSDTIRSRVRWLDGEAQEALRLAAVFGREFDFELLETVWGQGEEATLEALDQLLRRRLVVETTGALARDYAFTHHKIQEVIYADLPLLHRQRLHAQAGQAMERLYGAQVGGMAAELAFHFQEGAEHNEKLWDKATEYLLSAGDQARQAHAHQEAVGYYQSALVWLKEQSQHRQVARTLMKLGLTYHASQDYARAREAYDEGFVLWQRATRSDFGRCLPPPQTLRSWQQEPATLDPGIVTDWHSGVVIEQLFSALVRYGPDMVVLPEAATGWEVLEDGHTYRFHLRQDWRWSDGTPVTAHDFEYAMKRFLHPSRPAGPGPYVYNIRGARAYHRGEVSDPGSIAVRCLDAYTLIIELKVPDPNFLSLVRYIFPVPRHQVEALGDIWTDPGRLVSNGPFQLESWQRGESMVLSRNPHYAGHLEGNLQCVELSFALPEAAIEAYEAGHLDVLDLDIVPAADKDRLHYQHPGEYLSVPGLSTYHLRYDLGRPPFHDRRVRRAFAQATDTHRLADLVLGGHVFPATGGQVPPSAAGHSPGIALPYRPSEARQLLTKAGYPGGRNFPAVELLVVQGRETIVEDLSAQWLDNMGVQVDGRTLPWAALLDRMHGQPPHILGSGSAGHYPDPATFVGAAQRDDAQAAYRWHHKPYDQLVEKAAHAVDQAQRLELFQQMDRMVIEEAWMVPLWYGRRHLLIKPWVVRLPTSPILGCFWKDIIVEPH